MKFYMNSEIMKKVLFINNLGCKKKAKIFDEILAFRPMLVINIYDNTKDDDKKNILDSHIVEMTKLAKLNESNTIEGVKAIRNYANDNNLYEYQGLKNAIDFYRSVIPKG